MGVDVYEQMTIEVQPEEKILGRFSFIHAWSQDVPKFVLPVKLLLALRLQYNWTPILKKTFILPLVSCD